MMTDVHMGERVDEEKTKARSIDEALSLAAVEAIRTETSDDAIETRDLKLGALLEAMPCEFHEQTIFGVIVVAYSKELEPHPVAVVTAAVAAVLVAWERLNQTASDPTLEHKNSHELDDKERAFEADYVGDADVEFRSYLARCCEAYYDSRHDYTAPCIAITQSSGFGKSRILKELAKYTSGGNVVCDGKSRTRFSMTVLYVNLRKIKRSTGYPRATPALSDWLFKDFDCDASEIATRLLQAFKYARDNADAGKKWLKLFENRESSDGYILDNSIGVVKTLRAVNIEGSAAAEDESKQLPVLVVVIDDARALLQIQDDREESAFHKLQRALSIACRRVNGLIFAVLVDSRSMGVPDRKHVPARFVSDPSSRPGLNTGPTVPFPAFILTHTMDVMLEQLSNLTSKERVLVNDAEQVWMALVAMGRPLWRGRVSNDYRSQIDSRKEDLVQFASSKLLLGFSGSDASGYNDQNHFGIAALLCRIGVCPHSWSALSICLIADSMSVLHYVSYKGDAHISGYVSEPILTFGAAHTWYQLDTTPALETFLLPQFKSLLIRDVLLNTGKIGKIVARIFVLLAMDATMMGEELANRQYQAKFVFSGQFCSVCAFLEMLLGAEPEFREEKSRISPEDELNNQRQQFNEWMEKWRTWEVSFSHFVDLEEAPTKETLWTMLDRRAAGVFPSNHNGADLVIPIYTRGDAGQLIGGDRREDVSAILIRVKNRDGADVSFPTSALRKPAFVYEQGTKGTEKSKETANLKNTVKTATRAKGKKHPRNRKRQRELKEKCQKEPLFCGIPVDKMIRLYLSLRETPSDALPARSVVIPKQPDLTSEAAKPTSVDYALCLRGMFADDATETPARWPFLSIGLTNELRALASSAWWDGMTQLEGYLDESKGDATATQGLAHVLPPHTALKVASKALMMFSTGR